MSTALLTPFSRSEVTTDAQNPRRFRKQILPVTSIKYNGQDLDFNKELLANVVSAYKDGAVHQVPFQLADENNRHNNDPERTRGELVDLELTADGLVGTFDLDERGVDLIKHNPNLGVSARIEQGKLRATDGKTFPHVLQHVLGVLDPKVPGTKPWEKVDLSNEDKVTETIDLSAVAYPGETEDKMAGTTTPPAPGTKPEDKAGQKTTVELSADELTLLQQVLSDQKVAAELANGADDEDEDGVEIQLSAEATQAIELANAEIAVVKTQAMELANQLRSAQVDAEVEKLRGTGLSPALIDLARPVLELPVQAIELSNGNTVDPGKVMRDLLHQVISLSQTGHAMIDLDEEAGVIVGTDSVQAQRADKLKAWNDEYGTD